MTLHVAILEIHLHLPGVGSLKEKRSIVKSLLERIRQRFPVSAAEVDFLDQWQQAELGFAMAGNQVPLLQRTLEQVVHFAEDDGRAVVADYRVEIIL
ncbi:MAG: DUF503 domain-containing protein [Magnetococcales bacterium]|nr:DUF503 domain-containing protein [Magnetococcales bacterium]